VIEPDLLDGNYLFGGVIPGLVDHPVGALPYFVDALVPLGLSASRIVDHLANELNIINKINKDSIFKCE